MTITNVFVETQFPTLISYNSTGGPGFSTTIFTSASGREQRNINWSLARAQYDISQAIKHKSDMDEILVFFMAMMGKAYAFRYKDWADFQITNQVVGTGNGTQTVFQIFKTYTVAGQTYTRTIKKPVSGSLQNVLVNSVVANPTTYTIDYTAGTITFTSPVTNTFPVAIDYIEFDVPVRFDTDVATIRQDFYQVESWEGIKLVEVKL